MLGHIHRFENIPFTYLIDRYMPLVYLTLLKDFDLIPIYSWGSTVLACLYRYLYVAFMKKDKTSGGMFATFTSMNKITSNFIYISSIYNK